MTDHASSHLMTGIPGTTAAPRPYLLRRVFAIDRIVCGASAVVVLARAPWVAEVLDWSTAAVAGLGLVLVLNTVLLEVVHRRVDQHIWLARASVIVDLVFAVGLTAVPLVWSTSTVGTWALGATALFVVDVAIAKFVGLRRA